MFFRLAIFMIMLLFCIPQLQAEPELLPGWPQWFEDNPTFTTGIGSANLVDMNGDGTLEIITGIDNGIYVLNYDGALISGWPQTTAYLVIEQPAIGDITGDGYMDVVATVNDPYYSRGRLYAWNRQGEMLLNYELAMGPEPPVLYDLNNDHKCEIIVGDLNNNKIVILDGEGNNYPGWPVSINRPWGNPGIGDIDRDGALEILFSSQASSGVVHLNCFELNGSMQPPFPLEYVVDGAFLLKAAAPLIDIDGDGFQEILFRHCISYGGGSYDNVSDIVCYDGAHMDGWPITLGGLQSCAPSACDIIPGGNMEIALATYGGPRYYLLDTFADSLPGWPFEPEHGGSSFDQPVFGDVDGDGEIEVLFDSNNMDPSDSTGYIWALEADGSMVDGFPLRPKGFTGYSAPALGDINNDNILDLCCLTMTRTVDYQRLRGIWVYSLNVPYDEELIPWPMSMHDPQHTCNYEFDFQTSVDDRRNPKPEGYYLTSNHPNPFNPSTKIEFGIPNNGYVNLKVYNLLGQEIAELVDEKLTAGEYSVAFNGDNLSSGIYFYHLKFGDNKTISRKMLLLK